MREADLEAGRKNLAEYLQRFYHAKQLRESGQPTPPVTFDPVVVGKKARQYQREQREKGTLISATQAVEYILANDRQLN